MLRQHLPSVSLTTCFNVRAGFSTRPGESEELEVGDLIRERQMSLLPQRP